MEALVHDKDLVTEPIVRQAFADHLRNDDGYTIQRTFAGFASPQFVDARLGSIRAPTLVVWGREDEMIPLAAGEKLRDGIAGARLVVFDHCGHLPHVEKPAEFTRAVLEFLAT
jgi:4,5:9,10-diseco-3-hydroxy-5,9,17-trioxoandrosta-1(10),2-diene-4-oate hydrolase